MKLPRAFIVRAMRGLQEQLWGAKDTGSSKPRCYYEHTDEAEVTACGKLHMRYDEEKGYGVFGRTVRCDICQYDAESSDSDSTSEQEPGEASSESDSD